MTGGDLIDRKRSVMRSPMKLLLLTIFGALSLSSPVSAVADSPLKLAVTDIAGLENLQRDFGPLQKVLSDATALQFELLPVTSRTAAVEALNAKKLDFVLSGPAEYVVLRKKTGARAVIGIQRPDYFSSVIVMTKSGIRVPADLKGHKVAFGDFGSTSYHLAPMQLLKDSGIDPSKDIKAMHVSKQIAWEALKRGDVDAIGMNYDRFLDLRAAEKSLSPEQFRVVARGPDLPNDVLSAGPQVSNEIVAKIREAFRTAGPELATALLQAERNKKYKSVNFITDVSDSDYDYVRSMYSTIGYPEFAEFVGPG